MAYSKKKVKANLGVFIKQYKRKRHAGYDPNDRSYDRKMEQRLRQMKPEDIAKLMDDI